MKKLSLLLIMALLAMTASAYTYYSNIEIGNFKYSQLALGSSSSEENIAYLKGFSSTASTSLTTLDIPGYVTYNGNRYRVKQINQQAFENNTKITTVNFGYGVENIGGYVFNGCTSLKYVNLPSSVKEIGQFTFQNCTSLLVVAFAGEKAPKIYDYTFNLSSTSKKASTATYRGMNALKADSKWVAAFGASNILRHYNYKVGDFEVYNSTNGCWQYYTIKNGIPYNGNSSNPSLRSSCVLVGATFTDGSNYRISLPQSVGNSDNNPPGGYKFYGVADSAFMGNTSITQVTNNSTMGYRIGNAAFRNCTSLQSVDVPVDTIDMFAFYGCTNLYSVNFSSSLCNLVYLGSYAFGKCNLSSVTIPQTTKYIGYAPFYDNSLMTDITVNANNPNYCSYYNALYNKSKTILYQLPGNWQEGVFAETLQRVYQYAATGCKFSSLYLPYNLIILEQYAFQNCKNLKLVHFPSSVTTVNANTFAGCDAINQVEFNTVTPPAGDIFPAVTDKSSVDIYMPYGSYDAYANSSIWSQYNRKTGIFDHQNCWDIRNYNFRYTVTSNSPYSKNGFSGDGTVKVVKIPSSGSFSIPSSLSYAGKNYVPNEVGYRVGQLVDDIIITQDPSITTIGDNAFEYTYLKKIPFTNVEIIGKRAFMNCYKLSEDLGTGSTPLPHLKNIMEEAFSGSGITAFTAPTCLEYIGYSAFSNCDDLHEIFLPHIDGKHTLTCGDYFFHNNASDFKCWVDYRRLNDFINSLINLDESKVFPHAKLDSEWQTFACVKPIDFEGSGLTAYTVTAYNQSEKKAILSNINTLKEHHGAVVHGDADGTYYRLKYSSLLNNPTSEFLQGVTYDQTVHSDNTTSCFKFNANSLAFDKVTTNTDFNRGYAYLKIPTSQTGGATTIYTNLSEGSGGIYGDVNGDGIVTAADVTAIYDVLLNNDYSNVVNGDVNGDGDITAGDVTEIYNILLGQ